MKPLRILMPGLSAIFLAASVSIAAPDRCSRVVAVGDLHGGYEAFLSVLEEARVLDREGKWLDEEACLVQTGDVVDRGDRSREILDLLIRLTAERPTRVHALLGNHEIMNLVGDLRYVSGGEFAAFEKEETAEERERGYRLFAEEHPEFQGDGELLRIAFDRAHPAGWFAHRRAFSPEGRYGRWLLSQPVVLELQGTLFVHGGIDPVDAPLGVEELNRKVRGDLQEYLQTREALIRDGWLHRLIPFGEDFSKVQLRLKAEMLVGEHTDTDEAVLRRARRFLELVSNDFSGEDAPVWSRKLALSDEVEFAPILDEILGQLGVERIVVGHTPQRTKEIGVRFGGKVFLIDTGAGPTYGGRPSALEIEGDAVRAIYPGESRLLVAPTEPSDREIERILLEGEIVEMKEIGQGITRPMKVLLELDGKQRKAAFKTVDIHKTGLTYLEGAPPEPNFTDSYLYERAAYLLDRELGLRMVPVTVLRRIGSRAGALVDWVEGAIDGEKRLQSKMEPEDPSFLERQQAAMTVFDALIYNTDRNLGNQLFTPSDWKLHLIDHTRCFRQHKTLPAKFGDRQMRLPRRMYEGLIAMEDDHLEQLLDGLLTKSRLKALLERRKLILERVERDRGRFGDEITFYEDSESDVPAANP